MSAFHQSIRWRVQVWHGLILLLVLVAFGVTALGFVREIHLKRVDEELQRRLSALLPSLRFLAWQREFRPGAGSGLGMQNSMRDAFPELRQAEIPQALFEEIGPRSFYFVVWTEGGKIAVQSATAPSDVPMPESRTPREPPHALPPPERFSPENDAPPHDPNRPRRDPRRPGTFAALVESGVLRTRDEWRERTWVSPNGHRVVVGRSLAPERAELTRLAWLFTGVGSGVLLLGWLVGWWLSARAIRPIDNITVAAKNIAAGNFSERINLSDTESELGELAAVLNETFHRLQAAFARQAQFTADAAHELRTPAFVILSQAQSALKRERSPADYKEGFAVCERAAQQMRQLIESLLVLARQDSANENFKKEPCALEQIAAEAIDLLKPLAAERTVFLHTDLSPAIISGDAQQLRQIVTNLVSNAIEYNRPGGEVRLRVAYENSDVVLTVRDNGIGISPEDLPHIFERFYRADKSRSSSSNHTGLGLAICQSIVETHGGVLEVSSRFNEGSIFTARFPGRIAL